MPHINWNKLRAPSQLSDTGTPTRQHLVDTQPVRDSKPQIPINSKPPEWRAEGNSMLERISPMTYNGKETFPDQVLKDLFGGDYEENDAGVVVRV